ncbi:MAG: DUF1501 domain-containing protein, partial [Verrucomicrobiota bacterium]|nr:DUF1501 domain-containing protein [Verrucomicrobiota bacterium]
MLEQLQNGTDLTRRGALCAMGGGALAAMGPGLARAATPLRSITAKARSVILIFNGGAPSHLDLWDPKPDAPEEIRG